MTYETLLVESSGGVETIMLNRPESLNALLLPLMYNELLDAVRKAAADTEVRCVILTGAGRAFCAGADLGQPLETTAEGEASGESGAHTAVGEILASLQNMPKPTIAAVNGAAAGAGCGLALACDITIASDRASFTQAFVHVGLHPDFGMTWILPRLIGPSRAREMFFTGRKVNAEEAERIGMVNHVVPHEEFAKEVTATAMRLARSAPQALRLTKQTLIDSANMNLEETVTLETERQLECVRSAEFREGLAAFREKRSPEFH